MGLVALQRLPGKHEKCSVAGNLYFMEKSRTKLELWLDAKTEGFIHEIYIKSEDSDATHHF